MFWSTDIYVYTSLKRLRVWWIHIFYAYQTRAVESDLNQIQFFWIFQILSNFLSDFIQFLDFSYTSGRNMEWDKKMYHGGFFLKLADDDV